MALKDGWQLPYWPSGTRAATTHQFWIESLDKMVELLSTPLDLIDASGRLTIGTPPLEASTPDPANIPKLFIPPGFSIETWRTSKSPSAAPAAPQETVQITPDDLVEDFSTGGKGGGWMDMDLDRYLEQISMWRQTLLRIWKQAMDDPAQMTVADITTACAIRHFKDELAEMEKAHEHWYRGESGCWTADVFDAMERRQPDGTGHDLNDLWKTLKGKRFAKLRRHVSNDDMIPRQEFTRYVVWPNDLAYHKNPLVDWIDEIADKHNGSPAGPLLGRADFLVAWLLREDSITQAKEHTTKLRRDMVVRLLDVTKELLEMRGRDKRAPRSPVVALLEDRVTAMQNYTKGVTSVPSAAIVHTWAAYFMVTLNICHFEFYPATGLRSLMYTYDLHDMLYPSGPRADGAREADQFRDIFAANLYPKYLMPEGRRPSDLNELYKLVGTFLDYHSDEKYLPMLKNRIADRETAREYGKDWEQFALVENQVDDNVIPGTKQWWAEIEDKARQLVREPGITSLYNRASKEGGKRMRQLELMYDSCRWGDEDQKEYMRTQIDELAFGRHYFENIIPQAP
ncbi:hypothetical protein F5Y08DRAFT_354055 [Xylaria arbuscula]|nr:hypothetical protein F5Y08DRAFT_354055 [Xylaria arbuscula]